MFLTVPENLDFFDFLVDQIPDWKNLDSINITKAEYNMIINDPKYSCDNNIFSKIEESSKDSFNPLISFELKQITFDLWDILWIEYDGSRHYFTNNPIGRCACITCKLSA